MAKKKNLIDKVCEEMMENAFLIVDGIMNGMMLGDINKYVLNRDYSNTTFCSAFKEFTKELFGEEISYMAFKQGKIAHYQNEGTDFSKMKCKWNGGGKGCPSLKLYKSRDHRVNNKYVGSD